jgi:hypothetical protein
MSGLTLVKEKPSLLFLMYPPKHEVGGYLSYTYATSRTTARLEL